MSQQYQPVSQHGQQTPQYGQQQQPQYGQQTSQRGQQQSQHGGQQVGHGTRFGQGARVGTTGQQMGVGGQQSTGQFQASLSPELRTALQEFNQVAEVAEWCADKCIDAGPQMANCIRACQDVADLAELNEKLIARDSVHGPKVAEAFLQVAQQALPEIQRHGQSHTDETASVIQRAVSSTNQLLSSVGGQSGIGQTGMGGSQSQGIGTGQQGQY